MRTTPGRGVKIPIRRPSRIHISIPKSKTFEKIITKKKSARQKVGQSLTSGESATVGAKLRETRRCDGILVVENPPTEKMKNIVRAGIEITATTRRSACKENAPYTRQLTYHMRGDSNIYSRR